jgi:DNA (cytosine-5)-methyltransferase 1
MVEHLCATCEKVFKQKSQLDAHKNRKKPCKKDDTIEKIVEKKVEEVLTRLNVTNLANSVTPVKISKTIRYVDLFSGIGGFRYGIEAFRMQHPEFSFNCIKTVDIKRDALATYNLNFQETNEACDIRTVTDLGPFEMLCAGFPCQPFSSAGRKEGLQDKNRGNLIYEVLRICRESNPTYLVLENVSNIERIDNGNTLRTIVGEFKSIGYNIQCVSVNSKDVGLAQDRSRLFIMGSRLTPLQISLHPGISVNVEHIIDYADTHTDLPGEFVESLLRIPIDQIVGKSLKDKRGGEDNIHSWDIGYHGHVSERQKHLLNTLLKERRKKKWADIKGIVWMDGMPLTLSEIRSFLDYTEIEEDLTDLVDRGYLRFEHPKELVNGKREYSTASPAGYNINKGKLSFPVSKILHPNDRSPTLTATDSSKLAVVCGDTIRQLNATELKRLCGFPETMIVPDSVDKYDLFGNMVCPPVVTALLNELLL